VVSTVVEEFPGAEEPWQPALPKRCATAVAIATFGVISGRSWPVRFRAT
jgi:hypothetical protein